MVRYNPHNMDGSNVGRWLTPDPMARDVTNPQSHSGESPILMVTLNRYAYVTNNPATLTDPLGLVMCPPGGSGGWCDPLRACGPPPCDPFTDISCNPAGWRTAQLCDPGKRGHSMFFPLWAFAIPDIDKPAAPKPYRAYQLVARAKALSRRGFWLFDMITTPRQI